MYNDLNPEAWEDNVDLTKNELIQAIFNPAKNDQESFKEEDIDSRLEYQNMYQVLDADSSQIAAIQDVKAGRNLVVEGPPGTGKSQTIVNLIAELLAEGKSVLFVSEKMAALDVVKDRLTAVGLGKFVLELHSHKTRRKKFLKDLQKATNVRAHEPLNIDQTIRKLETLRRQLDDYSQIIHKPVFAVNLSAFQLYGMKESADDHFARKDTLMPLVRFESPESVTLKDLDDMKIALENLAELYQTISKENPWSKCAPKSLLPADLREIEMLINDTLLALDNFLVERGRVYDIYGIKKPDTLNEFQNSLSAFEIIKSQNAELIDGSILKSGAWEGNNDDAFRLIQELQKYQKYSVALTKFNQSIFQADIDRLIYELQHLSTKKFRFFNNKQHIELVERYYAVPVTGSVEEIIRDLQEAKVVIQIRKNLEANDALGRKYFGGYWHLNANVDDLKTIARWMHEFTALVRDGTFSQNTIDLMSKDLFDIKPERDLAEYIDSGEEFVRVLSRLKDKLNPRSKLIFKRETGDVPFEAWKEQLYNWRGQLSSLHLWSQYLSTKQALSDSNAKMFVSSIEKRNIKKDDIAALVEGNFADSLLNILFVENHELATFVGELHENRIREFKDLDKKILTLNRKRIYHKLNSNIPKIFGGTENPQAKILAGEFTRKSGHMPVRKLLEKAGGMIKQIKPCFMMSPLSIAQYLDPTNEELQFDVVIFDEASQVKPEDALGAFMRGKTAVVMGDTQQLPPTSFFDQMSDADSDEEEATSLDMESILHLCKLSFPVKMLKWHYRSRHESLITVSNREFYDDDLLVYPSPSHSDPELGLKFHYNPNTQYLRGASSKNPLEAKDVVEEIFNHFEKYGDTKSLGVGTFSVAQKNAILEELEVKRKEHPEYEPLFSDNKEERFFVKNLETIQGDERDVILISVGYGYDQDGKMSLNFGPLNQDGGERRLNVLITRAREKCVVFSNFKAYDMNLTANPPYGVKSLKEFLEYAENLTLGTNGINEYSKEPFEDAIASFLEENGYTVDRQIGCAGFRVDLAIVDDEDPGKYILGITTDGKMYSSSKVARDRDRLREQVLTGLGWKLYHLWSTDWYRNRDLGRKKLLESVEKSIRKTREEEKRRSEEEKRLAEKRRLEAEKKAEELRIAREKEEAERKAQEEAESDEINPEDIGPADFVEVEKAGEDILEKPIDVSELDPDEFFKEVAAEEVRHSNDSINDDSIPHESEFVEVETPEESVDYSSQEMKSDIEEGPINEDVVESSVGETVEEVSSAGESDDAEVHNGVDEEISESEENPSQDDDAEVWESDEGVAPEDNAEVWENEKDYSDGESSEKQHKSIKERFKSFINPGHSELDDSIVDDDESDEKESFLSSLRFKKDLDNDSEELEDSNDSADEEITENISDNSKSDNVETEDEYVDLGSDEDYIIVDHSNDEVTEEIGEIPKAKFKKQVKKPVKEEMFDEPEVVGEPVKEEVADEPRREEFVEPEVASEPVRDKVVEEPIKPKDEPDEEIVDLGSDDDYIYVDHSHDDERVYPEDEPMDFGFEESEHDDKMNLESENKVDSQDEIPNEESTSNDIGERIRHKPRRNSFKSMISDVVGGETQLQPKEVKTVRGEFIDDDDEPLHKPAPSDDNVVEAEIVTGDDELNVLNDDFSDYSNDEKDYWDENDEELNIFNDTLPDLDNEDDVLNIVDNAKKDYLDDIFEGEEVQNRVMDKAPVEENRPDENIEVIKNNPIGNEFETKDVEDNEPVIQDDESEEIVEEKVIQEATRDGVTYYQGSNDVTSKLRKNNFYYDDEKPRSVKDSIRGIKKDMRYINKSLKEIENPTKIDYVSVVDRTEEYNPADYLNMPSDDDSDKILEKEEGLTFAEKEELRIEEELKMEVLKKELASDEEVIIPVHEQFRREELKDQALEDIIQSADEDYKEIEKERFRQNNQLKSFDNHKLPGKKSYEDNIVNYVESTDIGLGSSDDLYNQPIDKVSDAVKLVVDIEGPIHVSEVTKRVKDSCHIKRAGSKLKKTVNSAISNAESKGDIIKIGDFLYDSSNNDVLIRRRNKPNIELISDEEIAKSIELVLTYNKNITTKQIPKETSRNFGFKSTSKKTASRINSVLDLMIANNRVKIVNDFVELK